jgi:hypothetical protein
LKPSKDENEPRKTKTAAAINHGSSGLMVSGLDDSRTAFYAEIRRQTICFVPDQVQDTSSFEQLPKAQRHLFETGCSMPSRRRSDAQPPKRDPLTEAIAARAYELFLERGAEHGHNLDDWLRAERELLDAARMYVNAIKPETTS